MDLKFIRTLEMRTIETGGDATAATMDKLATAHKGVAQAAATTTTATDRQAKSQKSLRESVDALEKRFDPLIRNQLEFEKVERRMMAAAAAQPELRERANAVIAKAAQHYDALSQAAVASGKATIDSSKAVAGASNAFTSHAAGARLARHELINLSRQAQDVGVSLFSGQSPLTVLVQQGSQIADVFANSTGTIGGFFSQIGSGIARIFTPMRVLVGGVAGIGVAALSAANSWGSAQLEISKSLQGIGRASGASVNDITRIGVAASSAFGLSISEATVAASAYAATGKIATREIETLTKLTKDFAATLNLDVSDAVKVLAESFSDPVKGAEEMSKRLGGISPIIKEQIGLYSSMNQRAEAQRVLVQAITPQLTEAAKVTGFFAASWTAVSNAASGAWTDFGKVMSSLTGIGEGDAEKLRNLREEYILLLDAMNRPEAFGSKGGAAREDVLIGKANKIAAEMAKLQAELSKNDLEKSAQAFRDLANKGQEFADAIDPSAAKMRELNAQLNIFNSVLNSDNKSLVLSPEQVKQWEFARSGVESLKNELDRLQAAYGGVSAKTAVHLQAMQSEAAMAMQLSEAGRQQVQIQQFANQVKLQAIPALEKELLITQQMITQMSQLAGAYQNAANQRMFGMAQAVQTAQVEAQIANDSAHAQERIRFELQATQQIQQQLFQLYGATGLAAVESGNRQALAAVMAAQAQQGLGTALTNLAAAQERLRTAQGGGSAEEVAAAQQVVEAQLKVVDVYQKRIDSADKLAETVLNTRNKEVRAAKESAKAIADANELRRQEDDIRKEGAEAERDAQQAAATAASVAMQRTQEATRSAEAFGQRWERNKKLFEELAQKIQFVVGFDNQFDEITGNLFQQRTSSTKMWTKEDGSFSQFNPAGYQSTIRVLHGATDAARDAAAAWGEGGFKQTGGGGWFNETRIDPTTQGIIFKLDEMQTSFATLAGLEAGFAKTMSLGGGVTDQTIPLLQRLVQLAPEENKAGFVEQMIAEVKQQPVTLAREELLKSLNEQLKSLTEASESLEDSMRLQLDPLFSQGHDYINALKIGYYKAATGLTGVVAGSGSGDKMPVHMMLEPGELLKVIPRGRWSLSDLQDARTAGVPGNGTGALLNPLRAQTGFTGIYDKAITASSTSGLSLPITANVPAGFNPDNLPIIPPAQASNDNSTVVNNYNTITIAAGATDTAQKRLTARQAMHGFARGATAAAMGR